MARANSCGNVIAESDSSRSARAAQPAGRPSWPPTRNTRSRPPSRLWRPVWRRPRSPSACPPGRGRSCARWDVWPTNRCGPGRISRISTGRSGRRAQKILRQGVGVRILGLADEIQIDLHRAAAAGISIRSWRCARGAPGRNTGAPWERKRAPADRRSRPAPIRPASYPSTLMGSSPRLLFHPEADFVGDGLNLPLVGSRCRSRSNPRTR